MRMFLMALVAMSGLGFAAAPSLADHCNYGNRVSYYRGHGHGHTHYRPPVSNCGPVGCNGYVAPCAPRVVARPGFYYNGRNVAFGIGF